MGSWTGTPRAHGNLNERAESKARSVERRARDGLASPTQVLLPLGSGPSLYDVTSTILPRPPSLSFALFFSLAPSPPLSFFPSFSISVPAPSFSRPPVFLLLRSFPRPAATRPAFSVSLLRSLLLSSLLIHAVTLFLLSLPPSISLSLSPSLSTSTSPSSSFSLPPFNLAPSHSDPVSAAVLAVVSPVPSHCFTFRVTCCPMHRTRLTVRLYSPTASWIRRRRRRHRVNFALATVSPQPRSSATRR